MPVAPVLPNSDVTTNWDTVDPGPNHYEAVNEQTSTPTDADFIETTTLNDDDRFGFEASPGNTDQVTQVDVHVRAKIDDSANTAFIRVELFHSGSTQVGSEVDLDGTDFGGYGTLGNATAQWTTLTLTKAQADSLEVELTFMQV
jgi:hypothetical protein